MASAADIISVALPCTVGVALIALALLVARSGGSHRYNLFFASLYTLSGIKSFSEGIDAVADGFAAQAPLFPPSLFWTLLQGFCAISMLPMLFLFAASFPRPMAWMTRKPSLGFLAGVPSAAMAGLLVLALQDSTYAPLFEAAVRVFNTLGAVIAVLLLVILLRTHQASSERVERTQALYLAVGFLPGFLAGWTITILQLLHGTQTVSSQLADALTQDIIHFLAPLGEIFAAGVVAFAILKYNILGTKPGFRLGVKSFLVGFIFVIVFLFTQFLENVVLQGQLFSFAGDYGSFILSGVTGIVLFKPIEKFSTGVSNRLLPKGESASGGGRAAEIYRSQCSHVLRDGNVTEREWAFLRTLRDQLGLGEALARSIEEEVERTLKVDSPLTGATATTALRHVTKAQAEIASAHPVVRRASPELAFVPVAEDPDPSALAPTIVHRPPSAPTAAKLQAPAKPAAKAAKTNKGKTRAATAGKGAKPTSKPSNSKR